jgi:hypothetical protein
LMALSLSMLDDLLKFNQVERRRLTDESDRCTPSVDPSTR